MKILSSIMLAASLLACAPSFAQDAKDVAVAKAATEHWLKLIDTEEYSAAWNNSSAGMREGIPKLAWTMLASATHLPLGTFSSRTLKSFSLKKPSGDKPGSEAIAFEYESRYEKNKKVNETITVVHEKDGVWRMSGYNINDGKP